MVAPCHPGAGQKFDTDDSICVLGINKRDIIFQPVVQLRDETDFECVPGRGRAGQGWG